MGYLTTVTVYNDGLGLLKTHGAEFAEKLYDASSSHETTNFRLGSFCNFANVQQTRHADDHTIYVHMGNCVTEVNPCSDQFKSLLEQNPEFARKLVRFLDGEVRELKRQVKNYETTIAQQSK